MCPFYEKGRNWWESLLVSVVLMSHESLWIMSTMNLEFQIDLEEQ